MPSNQYISREEAWERIRMFCAYQERSHKEVQDKLASLNQDPDTAAELITQLMEEDFLNEERFARAYVKGKFKHNDWAARKLNKA